MTPARCLIPAAGRGTRLRPVSATVPKELLPVGTRPLLQWCLTEALDAGFTEIAVVTRPDKPLIERYVTEGRWREGLLERLAPIAGAAQVRLLHQERPDGILDAIFAAGEWVAGTPAFAVFLPDNVRIAGEPPLTAGALEGAAATGRPLVACHRIGPETRHFYGNVGRLEVEDLTPAGAHPRVRELQVRGTGTFQAAPEGSWRVLPRWIVTDAWTDAAREVANIAIMAGRRADDVDVHRRLVETGALDALPWSGTMVDAGNPAGYLYAQHLLHEAAVRERDAQDEGAAAAPVQIELNSGTRA